MFFVVRSNDSFNFPLGLVKYIVIVVVLLESEPVSLLELILHYSVAQLYDDTFNNNSSYLKREEGERRAMRYSLTRVKLTALYKHLITKTTLTYISIKKILMIVA